MYKYKKYLQNNLVLLIVFLSSVMFDNGALIHLRVLAFGFIAFYAYALYKINEITKSPEYNHKCSAYRIIIKVAFGFIAGPIINYVIKILF